MQILPYISICTCCFRHSKLKAMQVFQLCYTDGSPTLGCQAILRSDYGTENATLATIHVTFRLQHSDSLAGEKSFMYGSSKSNIVSHSLMDL